MKLEELFEAKNTLPIDAIALALFKKKAGIVKDPKRDKEKDYLGVTNSASTFKHDGKTLHLSIDNSTDSGEFEIDSFTPLKLERGGDIDKAIKKLFKKFEIDSGKKIGYILKGETSYIREIHLGKKLSSNSVRFVQALIKLIKTGAVDDESEDVDSDEQEDKKPEKKEVKKPEKKPDDKKPKSEEE